MMIWLTLLPFTLWDNCGWAMLPITFIVSFLLLGEQLQPATAVAAHVSWQCMPLTRSQLVRRPTHPPLGSLLSILSPAPVAGIEEIGVSIEEPFTILPLETIARTIEANLRELEATHGPATLGKAPEGAMNATELLYEVIPSAAPADTVNANSNGAQIAVKA